MLLLLLYFFLALGVSFCCSFLEAVLLSLTPTYIAMLEKKGSKSVMLLKNLKDRIDHPLSAILTLNTVAHTVGAAGVGAQALKLWPGAGSVAITSAILTLLILVFSEIIPKTLGVVYWKQLAVPSGYCIRALIVVIYPLVLLFEALSRLFSPKGRRIRFSREEMMATVQIGQDEGTLLSRESRVIQNMLCLRNILVKDILTPRSVLLAFPQNATIAEVAAKYSPIRFSRIPIYGKDLDEITGIVYRYKIVLSLSENRGNLKLTDIASDIHAIPDTKTVASTLDEFIKRRKHIFLVVDEYGGTAGIITLEDAIETLLGVEIVDEFDTVEDMRKLALQLWEKRKHESER